MRAAVCSSPSNADLGEMKTMTIDKNIDLARLTEQMDLFLRRFSEMEKMQAALRGQVERLTSELAVNNEELKHKVQALEAVRDNLNYSFQGIAAGVVAVDRQGTITALNKAAENFLGLSAEQLAGTNVRASLAQKGAPLARLLERALRDGVDIPEVETAIGGTELSVGVSLIKLPVGNAPVGAVLTFKDLSELKKMQEHLARKSRLAALGEMAAGLAHEIRNPLGGIELYASLLSRDLKEQPAQKELIDKALKGVRLLNKIVEDMLAFTKDVTPRLKACDLRQALADTLQLLRPQLEEKRLRVMENYLWEKEIVADGELLRRAFLNIALNAAQITPADGFLKITTRPAADGERVEIIFQDSGPGLDEKIIDKIFNPFFTNRDKGTGLGLAIVHQIVESHGGEILAGNAPEGGAVFTIRLSPATPKKN